MVVLLGSCVVSVVLEDFDGEVVAHPNATRMNKANDILLRLLDLGMGIPRRVSPLNTSGEGGLRVGRSPSLTKPPLPCMGPFGPFALKDPGGTVGNPDRTSYPRDSLPYRA